MNKKQIITLVAAISACLISLFAVLPIQMAKSDSGAWMADLNDDRAINTLSIPGTHDSGATHSIADLSGKCQSLTIEEQLVIGVRFFDIRLKLNNNELNVVHSFVDQGIGFDEVLLDMVDYLTEHPTEFLIVSIKEDADPSGSDVSFTEKLEATLRACELVNTDTQLPETVGEARGRIHIISRYADSTIGFAAHQGWADSTSFALGELYVQDHYKVDFAETKIADIQAALEVARGGEYSLVLNFASCYYPDVLLPPTYAGLPAHTINPWLIENLSKGETVGVILCDFITSELCNTIIGGNFR